MPLSLEDFPEFQELVARLDEQGRQLQQQACELEALRKRQLRWVNTEQAEEITGLSRQTLMRARTASDSVIIYKQDHGIRYDYDSLLRHNERRAVGRGRLTNLLLPGLLDTSQT